MDFLNYDSEGSVDESADEKRIKLSTEYSNFTKESKTSLNSSMVTFSSAPNMLLPKGMSVVPYNTENQPIANLPSEVLGPENPFKVKFGQKPMNTEAVAIDHYTFDEQYQNFQRSGYAIDSKSNQVLGDYHAYVQESLPTKTKRKRPSKSAISSNLELYGEEDGPWLAIEKPEEQVYAPVEVSTVKADSKPSEKEAYAPAKVAASAVAVETEVESSDPTQHIIEPEEEDEKWERINERKTAFTLPPRPPRGSIAGPATSTFHGSAEKDFLGRSWLTPPAGLRRSDGDHACYIPKKCIKKFIGHTKGVQNVEFFPGTGHLLLSASMDGKCKIWDVYGDRSVRRTYAGHNEAIRSACFDHRGEQILSAAFDRYIRLWDTETGQVKATFSNRKMAYQVKFHPKDANIFLAPSHDNRIYQVGCSPCCGSGHSSSLSSSMV
jgi:pre-mRNA-processing factor 17